MLSKKLFTKFVCLLSLALFGNHAWSMDSSFIINKTNGSVKFFALGNPSAIRINGVGVAPEGKIDITSDQKTSKINGNFNFDLNSLNSGIEMRDSHMKEKYLEVDKFPTAQLSIEALKTEGIILKNFNKKDLPFTGKLNLHGQNRAVSGTTEIKMENDQLKILAKFKIKSSDFSINIPTFAGITVGDEIEIEVELNLLNKVTAKL